MPGIRPCEAPGRPSMLAIINGAARRYADVIPPDRWHEPYMAAAELDSEVATGVMFLGCVVGEALVGVMGIQAAADVTLIRHAYVSSRHQGRGVGAMLLQAHCSHRSGRMLVGTWAAADWAVRFYCRHGFDLCGREDSAVLLERYWTVPE